ncbi:unnamed protein product [Absidia cylindrospora]
MSNSPKAIAEEALHDQIQSRSPTGTPDSILDAALQSDLVDAPPVATTHYADMEEDHDDPVVAEFPFTSVIN